MIDTPASNDVLCGKDKTFNRNVGNILYRQLIISTAPAYIKMKSKPEKMNITAQIVHTMIHTHHSRFLKQVLIPQTNNPEGYHSMESTSYYWQEISITAARDKTSHALRFCAAQMELQKHLQHTKQFSGQRNGGRAAKKPVQSILQRSNGFDYDDANDVDEDVYPDGIVSSSADAIVVTPTIIRRSRRGRIQRAATRYSPSTGLTATAPSRTKEQDYHQQSTNVSTKHPIRHQRHRRTVSRENVVGSATAMAAPEIPSIESATNLPSPKRANDSDYHPNGSYYHYAAEQNHYYPYGNTSYHHYPPTASMYPPYLHYYNNYHQYHSGRPNDDYDDNYNDKDHIYNSNHAVLPMECPSSAGRATTKVTPSFSKSYNPDTHNFDDGDDDSDEDDLDAILREPIEWEDAVMENDNDDDDNPGDDEINEL